VLKVGNKPHVPTSIFHMARYFLFRNIVYYWIDLDFIGASAKKVSAREGIQVVLPCGVLIIVK
jgi:hypothetical protein